MIKQNFDDETLMAFADGELDEVTTRQVELAIEADEALAERVALFFETREALASTMKPLLDEPVPAALQASVQAMVDKAAGTKPAEQVVVPLRQKPTPVNDNRRWLMPVAASILAVVTGVGGYSIGRQTGTDTTAPGNEIARLLDSAASGGDTALAANDEQLHIVSSFRDEAGDFCREYELKRPGGSMISIACREDGNWVTRLAMSAPRSEGYTPASAQETIDAYLASINAGAPLTPDEEREALSGSK
jgi:hypothetical protein